MAKATLYLTLLRYRPEVATVEVEVDGFEDISDLHHELKESYNDNDTLEWHVEPKAAFTFEFQVTDVDIDSEDGTVDGAGERQVFAALNRRSL